MVEDSNDLQHLQDSCTVLVALIEMTKVDQKLKGAQDSDPLDSSLRH